MITLAVLVALSALPPSSDDFQFRIDIIRGRDTTSTTFRVSEGVEARALVEGAASVTRVQATVRKAPTGGCVRVTFGSVSAPDRAAVDKLKIEPSPLVEVCNGLVAETELQNGTRYRLSVKDIDPTK